jgi:hypothetical protein
MMGIDADAILFYGYPLEAEHWNPNPDYNDEDYDDWDWESVYLQRAQFTGDEDSWEARRAFVDAAGVSLGYTVCSDSPAWHIAVNDSVVNAYYGDLKEITAEQLTVDPAWSDKLARFAQIMGIEYHEPKWYLGSQLSY